MRSQSLSLVFWVAAAVVILDQITKVVVNTWLEGTIVVIPGVLSFHVTYNTGAAFSMFSGGGPFLGVAAVGAVGVLLYVHGAVETKLDSVAIGMILGGTIGNLLDRVYRGDGFLDGAVVDWIRFPNFPTFNIADSAITIGAVLLAVGVLRQR